LTDKAKADLADIVNYLNKFSPGTATKYAKLIYKKMNALDVFPNAHPFVRNERLRELGMRWTSARNYTIFFCVDEKKSVVYIEHIMYARCSFDAIL